VGLNLSNDDGWGTKTKVIGEAFLMLQVMLGGQQHCVQTAKKEVAAEEA